MFKLSETRQTKLLAKRLVYCRCLENEISDDDDDGGRGGDGDDGDDHGDSDGDDDGSNDGNDKRRHIYVNSCRREKEPLPVL